MNYLEKFPQDLQKKIEEIANLLSVFTNRAYLVGGCVRDILLNNKIKDLDIEVYDISPSDFDNIMQKYGAKGVGKTFFVYKIGDIDLALPRVERKVGIGHKAFEVEVVDDEQLASKRRDFTMNAMMVNIFDGKLFDFWAGHKSIENQTISLIDKNSFKEDSLRVLRAIQLSARFGFEIEKQTLEVMNEIDLSDLTKPRIFWEFEKLFYAQNLALGFVYMCRLNIFEKIFTCKINTNRISDIEKELKESIGRFVEELRPYYFFYIVANLSGFNALDWCKQIETPLHYQRALKNQPFFSKDINDKELLIIAIDMPIKKWLGNYKKEIITRAKKLDIYESIYTGGITIQNIIADGFEKEDIKIEYRRRVIRTIEEKFSLS
ncbi:CCA tRNA nucleotidyltransferase [Sulfurospirillum arcachonense]|uniref:CCA tRNA nucleotidyltransferase n=1 Tax=Sulfurospirillum arcachonense TaxID=57666 RepID=UPI00046A2FAD|nr:CCA tRNA nucleotidyltransferase [Sulfurospirillum arcachonense]